MAESSAEATDTLAVFGHQGGGFLTANHLIFSQFLVPGAFHPDFSLQLGAAKYQGGGPGAGLTQFVLTTPFTAGQPIAFTLSVHAYASSLSVGESEFMNASAGLSRFSITDADGNPIDTAFVQSVETPEPAGASLMMVAFGAFVTAFKIRTGKDKL